MYYITAIVPAYNEEGTIAKIIETLKLVDLIDNIIVVSDGSDDSTVDISKSYGIKVIELTKNVGKGGALKRGIDATKGEILLFLDADLIGLKPIHITNLLSPVISDNCEMAIGLFENGRIITDMAQKVTPFLTGQRAVKRHVIENVNNLDISRYGAELALTKYVKYNNIKYKRVNLPNVTHIMKEEKHGIVKGFKERIKMYWEIVKIINNNETKIRN